MKRFANKNILVGVGGSVAAYRACDLVRALRQEGARVQVAPTRAACAFVTPLTFSALSGRPVMTDVLEVHDGEIPHIEEAYRADLTIVAPASADLLAKMAHGLADEALLATLLSYRGPLLVAPAMESRMWQHPATQANAAVLAARGATLVGPVDGPLASGRSGQGRLAAVDDILRRAHALLAPQDLRGRRILITAGPTSENIDPVRVISNRSSGRMGLAIAVAAAERGAVVELVHGPMKASIPNVHALPTLRTHAVQSAAEMFDAVFAIDGKVDAAIFCAAVADFTPADAASQKMKKTRGEGATLQLVPTRDILATYSQERRPPVLVGFAAETNDVQAYGRDKLIRKNCDMIVANDVSNSAIGFDSENNAVFLLRRDVAGEVTADFVPTAAKEIVAERVMDVVVDLLKQKTAQSTSSKMSESQN